MSIDKIISLTQTLTRVEENLKEEMSILEFILEHTTDGYWDWNIKTNYEYFSPRFKEQLGYEHMAPTPESWQQICNPEDLNRAYSSVESHFKGETNEFSEILRLTHNDGHEVTVLCRGIVVKRDKDGNPERMVGTHHLIKGE